MSVRRRREHWCMDLFFNLPYILHPLLSPNRMELMMTSPTHPLALLPGPVWKPADPDGVGAGGAAGAAGDRAAGAGAGEQHSAGSLPEGPSQVLGAHQLLPLHSSSRWGWGGTRTLSDPFTSFQHTGPCLSLGGRPASGSQESQTCLGIFHFPPIGRST